MGEMCYNFPLPFSRNDTNIKTSLTPRRLDLEKDYNASKIRPKDASTQCETGASLLMCNTLKQPAKWTHVKAAGSQVEVTVLWSKAFCSHRHSASTPPLNSFSSSSSSSLYLFIFFFFTSVHLRWKQTKKLLWIGTLFILFICLGLLHLQFVSHQLPLLFSLPSLYLFIFSSLSFILKTSCWAQNMLHSLHPDTQEVLWGSCWGCPVGRWSRPSSIPSICTGTFEIRMCDSICLLFFYVLMYCSM